MTGKERLTAILQKQPKDRLSWAPLMDWNTLSRLPGEMNKLSMLDFCRHLGADIFLLNGWEAQHAFRSPELRWPGFLKQTESTDPQNPDILVQKWTAPQGELVGIFNRGHPVKYPVDSIQAIRLYREMWEGATFLAHDDSNTLTALEALVGDDGVITRFWGPSTIPRLLEMDMGTENFYLLNFDHPDEMDRLIRVMHERELKAFEHIAQGPWESATLCENTSTFYISPEIYAKYNMPHQRDFVTAMHKAGKPAILHMCGHVLALLDLIKETGCDGIHALTPPPTGNTPWEKALDVIGEDLVIIGCLDPTIWISGKIEEIGLTLDRIITPRIREANFVLAPFADGIPVPLERFEAIKMWIERNT
ncbi:MAG: uroporphyrinogen decarboxylase family protein [Syntrophus sp. (in: bacteria)]